MPDYTENVARGIALLDEKQPGWFNRIDLEELNLGSCFKCVLGQLFSNVGLNEARSPYSKGINTIFSGQSNIGAVGAGDCGFTLCDNNPAADWDELRCTWVRAIVAKRNAELCEV